MRPDEVVRGRTVRGGVAGLWDVALPGDGLPGVRMAGFTSRTDRLVDMQVVPFPALTLFLDFGDARLTDGAGGSWRSGGVVGLAPDGTRGSGRSIDCLQVRMSPLVAYGVFGASADLGGAIVSLEDLWGPSAVRMRELLHSACDWDHRFAVVRRELLRRQAERAVDAEVAYAWREMVQGRGQVRVAELAQETGWSRKRLWSRFRSQVGLTPKRAAQLVRFDRAVRRLAAGQPSVLVAAEGGYADQSHLHRDVMSFAGLTPRAVADAPWLDVDDVAWAARARAGSAQGA